MITNSVQKTLSPEARKQIADLKGPEPVAFSLQLLKAWLIIFAAIALAIYCDSAWVSIFAIFIVGSRQNVLGLLVHDQAHLLGYRNRFGDLVVNFLAGYPLLILTVEGYAQIHLHHHRDFFMESDPDFQRKSGKDWETPKKMSELAKLFLFDLLGINTIKFIFAKKPVSHQVAFNRRFPTPRWVRISYYLSLIVLLSFTGMWTTFLLYWILPLFTVLQLIVRWGALCEHQYNLPSATIQESTPVIINTWWEKILLPNLNFGMHAYHHNHSGVAFSKLPKIHEIYEKEELTSEFKIFKGYFPYLRYITTLRTSDKLG